jgi:hypothetical protein
MALLQAVIDAAVSDPLVRIFALSATGVVELRLLFRRHPLGRAAVRIIFLILLSFALPRADIILYQPSQPTSIPICDFVHAVLKIV